MCFTREYKIFIQNLIRINYEYQNYFFSSYELLTITSCYVHNVLLTTKSYLEIHNN